MPDRRIAPLLRLGGLGPAACLLSGCQQVNYNLLDAKGPIGAAEVNILIIATVIMLAIIVPTMIATLVFAWWYRASNTRARYRPDWAFSGRIELVVWSVPFLAITFLGGIAWIGAHRLDPAVPIDSSSTSGGARRPSGSASRASSSSSAPSTGSACSA